MYNYSMQLPNLNVPLYVPRTVRLNHLRRINMITLELSALIRREKEKDYVYVPGHDNNIINSLWLSGVISLSKLSKTSKILGKTEDLFASKCDLEETSVYKLVKTLDLMAQEENHRLALTKANKWTDVLLALMEGYSPMIGGSVYSSFKDAELTGIVPMPQPGEDLLGGQIINLVSFDQEKDLGLVIGNHGMGVGKRGQFQVRGSYLRNLNINRDFFVLVPRIEHAHR